MVDAWFDAYENPQNDLVQAVRMVLLGTDERLTEEIKWKAPTFICKGNLAWFFPKSTKHVTLMFPRRRDIPRRSRDPRGRRPGRAFGQDPRPRGPKGRPHSADWQQPGANRKTE